MGTFTIVSKNHDAWLKSREEGIGSSEVASVLGVNPYQTPYQLWLVKTGRVKEVEEENFLMKAGHYLEDAISRFCADEAGLDLVKSSAAEFVVVDKDKPFMRVSPDRYAYPKGAKKTAENKCIIECKSTQKPVDPDDLSRYWFVQCMYQQHVTRIHTTYLSWLIQGREFGYKRLAYDRDFCFFVEEEVERFWVDCVIGGQEPALVSVQDVLLKFPKHEEGKALTASDRLIEAWGELRDTNEKITRLTKTKEGLEEKIKTSMLDAERLVIPAFEGNPEKTLATWKASKASEKFDVDALKKAEPEVYARYLKSVPGIRRFSLK